MKKKKLVILTIMTLAFLHLSGGGLFPGYGYGQDKENPEADALKKELANAANDKQRVAVLNRLFKAYRYKDKQKALIYARQALSLASTSGDETGKALALRNNGLALSMTGQYEKGLEFHFQALGLFKEQGNKREIALTSGVIGSVFLTFSDYEKARDYYEKALIILDELNDRASVGKLQNNLGLVCYRLGQFDKSLEYYFKALKVKEKSGNKKSIGMTLMNIGIVYKSLGDYEKSLEYHEKSLIIGKELQDKELTASNLHNIGLVFRKQEKFGLALDHYRESMAIKKEIGDPDMISSLLVEIGLAYQGMKDYDKALEYASKALEIAEKIGAKDRTAKCLHNIGNIYYEKKHYPKAIEFYNRALEIAKKLNAKEVIEMLYKTLSNVHADRGEHDKSLRYLQLYNKTNEEMFGKSALSKVRKIEMAYELDTIRNRMNAKKRAELKYYFIFIGTLLVLLGLVMLNRYRIKRRALLLLEQKDRELSRQQDKLSQMGKKIQELVEATEKKQPKYDGSTLTPKEAKQYLRRILVAMETDKLYRDAEITTRSLARKLSMTQRDLSRVLNEHLDRNFNEFINQYRVQEAKELLSGTGGENGKSGEMSILEIAYHVGFNSKSSFNTVFKKITGETPSEFKKKTPGDYY